MRKYSLFFRCPSSLARCAVACCLGVLLLVPASLYARSTHSHYQRYQVRRGDTLSGIAACFGVTTGDLRQWNHLRSNRIAAGRSLYVSAPHERRATTEYRVRRGDTLTAIAGKFGTTVAELRECNHLRSNRIAAGHRLFLPMRARPAQEVRQTVSTERPRSYRVRPGDTLTGIASRFGTTVAELRHANRLPTSRIVAGQRLDLPVSVERQASQTRQLAASAPATSTHAPVVPKAAPTHVAKVSQPMTQQPELKNAVAYGAEPHLRGVILRESSIPHSMPTALYGTHEILVHQNIIADVEGLKRIQNTAELNKMIRDGDLVPLPLSSDLIPDRHLAKNRRYCRLWTAKFLKDLSDAHDKLFGRPLRITSAVRTAAFQRRLSRRNANAAPTSGEIASPHLTGEAIDIGKKGMSRHEIAWMRDVLGKLQAAGKLDVEEEFHQACFHISVYKTYVPTYRAPERLVASEKAPSLAASGDSAEQTSEASVKKVSTRSSRRSSERRVRHSRTRESRRVAARRRHRRSHHSVSLLAAGIR